MILALPQIAEQEKYVLGMITAMSRISPPPGGEIIDIGNEKLTEHQIDAVSRALREPISCVTGPAGSGKTFAIQHACDCFQQAGLSVRLAAPTGKAARRMAESTGRPAETIHRLLEHDGTGFTRGEISGPIETDVVIIDEVSMMDIPLAYHLFRAIDMARTRVILIGDHNQLPPVGPGNLLRDIIHHEIIPITRLTNVHRQAGDLLKNSNAILSGAVEKTTKPVWYIFNKWPTGNKFMDADDVKKFMLALFRGPLKNQLGCADLVNDIQVLAPMKKGTLGVDNLNIELQSLLQKQINGIIVDPVPPKRRPPFYIGDKVMQIKNNYKLGARGIMNGTTGIVTHGNPLVVNFDGEAVEIKGENKSKLVLAYAATVHKMQGSEVPIVIYICHKSQSFMHHRNLFYTAVTRASRAAIIIGDAWAIRTCAGRVETDRRETILAALCAARGDVKL